MPDSDDPIEDLKSAHGRSVVNAFQKRIKQINPDLALEESGDYGEICTMVALTHAHELRMAGEWPGPG